MSWLLRSSAAPLSSLVCTGAAAAPEAVVGTAEVALEVDVAPEAALEDDVGGAAADVVEVAGAAADVVDSAVGDGVAASLGLAITSAVTRPRRNTCSTIR